MSLNKEQHRNRHVTLHLMFDELLADFIKRYVAEVAPTTDLLDLPIRTIKGWSYRQTVEPDHEEPGGCGEDPA